MKEYTIGAGEEGIRLDKQLLKILNTAGTGFIYKMLRKKNITLNDKKASGNEHLKAGDIIKVYLSDETFRKFSTDKSLDLIAVNDNKENKSITDRIVYEDDDIILVNKPAGLLSQKARSEDISLNDLCLSYLIRKGEVNDASLKLFKPSICNRLDRNTSGLVIFAKNYKAAALFSTAIKDRTIRKYYLCPVKGRIDKESTVSAYLSKDEKSNKVSMSDVPLKGSSKVSTAYKPLRYNDKYTLLLVELITGKSHQIRAQMSYLGHPLIGDHKYGDKELNDKIKLCYGINSQALHAYKLIIPKDSGELGKYAGTYKAGLPKDMEKLIKDLFNIDIREIYGE